LVDCTGIIEKKIFGGVAFLVHGNMVCGVLGDELIARVSPENYTSALSQVYVRPFLSPFGKPMSGWIMVAHNGIETDPELQQWVEKGYEFASSLPVKK
jgi:TfoX/Sxy family transcriptional regulator of competence genes